MLRQGRATAGALELRVPLPAAAELGVEKDDGVPPRAIRRVHVVDLAQTVHGCCGLILVGGVGGVAKDASCSSACTHQFLSTNCNWEESKTPANYLRTSCTAVKPGTGGRSDPQHSCCDMDNNEDFQNIMKKKRKPRKPLLKKHSCSLREMLKPRSLLKRLFPGKNMLEHGVLDSAGPFHFPFSLSLHVANHGPLPVDKRPFPQNPKNGCKSEFFSRTT